MSDEIRYEMLFGDELKRRIAERPLVWMPFGILERHGDHLPWALDAMKAHGVCCRCARALGGVVLPASHLAGVHEPWKADPQANRSKQAEVGDFYLRAETFKMWLEDVFAGLTNIGFRCIVAYSGHYPRLQVSTLQQAADAFNASGPAKVIPFAEPMAFNGQGDHAGQYETSLLMALEPSLPRMQTVRPEQKGKIGYWFGPNPAETASKEFGEAAIETIIAFLGPKVREALG